MEQTKDQITRLFWTGGWDSTYRLIELLVFEKRKVRPIYIIDPGRRSVTYELKAMQKIKEMIGEKWPYIRANLLPTSYFELLSIKPDAEISKVFGAVKKKYPVLRLGIQNEWMAGLIKQYHLKDVEMGLQKSTSPFFSTFMGFLEYDGKQGERTVVKVKKSMKGSDEYELFKDFNFALTEITKPEMYKKAKENGFLNLMEQTWFCHNPRPSGKPCGVCVPCRAVMKEGMRFRMPMTSRIRYHLRILISADALRREYPKIYGSLKNIKHLIVGR